jgi:hypothetical protein
MGGKNSKAGDVKTASVSGTTPAVAQAASDGPEVPVYLNVYAISDENPSLPGFGIWHTGVEINGVEYNFGKRESSLSGISAIKPRSAQGMKYKETVEIGRTKLSSREIRDLISEMGKTYVGSSYHVTGRNCNHFSEEFSQRVCGQSLPGWVNRAAKAAHTVGLGGMIQKQAEEQQKQPPLPIAPSTQSAVQVDLIDLVAPTSLECLNEDTQHTLRSIMTAKPKKGAVLRSDADPQMLLTVGFVQHCRVAAVAIKAPAGPTAPRALVFYVNRRNMDFSAVESVDATCEMTLEAADLQAGKAVQLPATKFGNVKDITVFVRDNCGADITEISRLTFIGAPLINTDMSQFKAVNHLHEFYMDAD